MPALLFSQFKCPDSLIYSQSGAGGGGSKFIEVYDPRKPVSVNNPSATVIPNPQFGVYDVPIALLQNLNSGFPSPTLYTIYDNGDIYYWNGTVWLNTGHTLGQKYFSAGGCQNALYCYLPVFPQSNTGIVYKYSGLSNPSVILNLPVTGEQYCHDIVTDCQCNFYILSTQLLRKYDSNGNLLQTFPVSNLLSSTSSFAMIGNILYVANSNYKATGIFDGTAVTFTTGQITNSFGTSDYASCPFTTLTSIPATINSATLGCVPPSVSITANASHNPISYYWSGPGIGSSVAAGSVIGVSTPGTYTCAITEAGCNYEVAAVVATVSSNTTVVTPTIVNPQGLCLDEVPLPLLSAHASSLFSNSWSGPSVVSGAATASAIIGSPGVYSLQVTELSNGCSGRSHQTVFATPDLLVSKDFHTLCAISELGKSTTTISVSGAPSYSLHLPAGFSSGVITPSVYWVSADPGAPLPGALATVTVSGALGPCTATAAVSLSVHPTPTLHISVNDTVICVGRTLPLTMSGATAYHWLPTLNITQGAAGTATLLANNSVMYTVTGTDARGCDSPPLQWEVSVRPDFRGRMTLDATTRCAPFCGSVTLHPEENPVQPYSVLWKFRDDLVIGPVLNTCIRSAGIHTVAARILDSASACTTTLYFSIEAYPRPVAAFSHKPEHPVEFGPPVELLAVSADQDHHYTWYFADAPGTSAQGAVTERAYPHPGTYVVSLVERNQFGCEDTSTGTIIVEEDFAFYMPDSFTPNGDGRNDTFGPVTKAVRQFRLQVFNRWGTLIFASADGSAWDGTYRGQPCSQDSYTWKAEVYKEAGSPVALTGHVVLLR